MTTTSTIIVLLYTQCPGYLDSANLIYINKEKRGKNM